PRRGRLPRGRHQPHPRRPRGVPGPPPHDRPLRLERARRDPHHGNGGLPLMPVLDERHDFAHPVEGDTAWSESYYFNAYDPASDTGFFTRIGVRPNEGTMDVGLSAWLPGTELATVAGIRQQEEMVDTGLEVAGVRYERLSPMKEWRVTCDAEAPVRDLANVGAPERHVRLVVGATFSALVPPIGVDGQGGSGSGGTAAPRGSVGKGHLEQ